METDNRAGQNSQRTVQQKKNKKKRKAEEEGVGAGG